MSSETSDRVIAIDAGTTGITVRLYDQDLHAVGQAYREIRQIYPKPGWVEHDPAEIASVAIELVGQVLHATEPSKIAALGITNQRETVVVWDAATGKPLANAIVWQCRRTVEAARKLKDAGHEPLIRERTGLVADAYFSGPKIAWILDHVPGAREAAAAGRLRAGTIDTWLIWNLTGGLASAPDGSGAAGAVHATDHTNASRTMLYRLDRRAWDPELCELLQVPMNLLPEVRASAGDYGRTAAGLFPARIPIRGVAGDQQSALFGQGCHLPGEAKNTYGTGAFMLQHTGDKIVRSKHGLLTTLACDARGRPQYALEGSVFIAGAAIQWLRDGLGIIGKAGETEALARSIAGNDGVYLVPAFVGLGAPYWDGDARGALVGLTRGTSRAHLARAALEAIAYQSRDLAEAMEQDVAQTVPLGEVQGWGSALPELRVDGGATANDFLMQFQADQLGTPVLRPADIETTSLGAGVLAGVSAGVWEDGSVVRRYQAEGGRRFSPSMPDPERARLYDGWKQAVRRVLIH